MKTKLCIILLYVTSFCSLNVFSDYLDHADYQLKTNAHIMKKSFDGETVSLTFCKKPVEKQKKERNMSEMHAISLIDQYAQVFSTPINMDLEPKTQEEIIDKMLIDIANEGGIVESYGPCEFQNYSAILSKGTKNHILFGELFIKGLLVFTNKRYYIFSVVTQDEADLDKRLHEFLDTISISNS